VVDLGQPELTTTENAALQKDMKAVREPTLEVAVLAAPETSDSGEGISDAELEQLFGTDEQASESPEQVTEVQKVAAAGAAAPATPLTALAAPLKALKPPRAPEATREALARALGGAKRLADLLEEIPPGLRQGSRHRWVSEILPERVQELARQGREQETMHPWTAITQLLDREIGATIKRGNGKGTATAVMPGAYMTAEERDAKSSSLPAVELGQTWYSRKSGKAYLVREVTSQSIFVEGVGEYALVKFHSLFRGAEGGAEA
jgi:predicted transcriptional regulator